MREKKTLEESKRPMKRVHFEAVVYIIIITTTLLCTSPFFFFVVIGI